MIKIPEPILKVLDLDDYSVFTRYPGDYAPVQETEYKEAIDIAESVYEWVEKQITK